MPTSASLPAVEIMADYGASGLLVDGVCEDPEAVGLNPYIAQCIRNWNHLFNLSDPRDGTGWWEDRFLTWFR